MIEHRTIMNLIRGDNDMIGFGPGSRVAQMASLTFDTSLQEVSFFAELFCCCVVAVLYAAVLVLIYIAVATFYRFVTRSPLVEP